MQVKSLDQEDPLEEGTAPHFRILAWRIPRTEEPGGLQSIQSQRVGHNCRNTHILKVKNEWLYEYRVNVSMSVVYSHDLRAGRTGAQLTAVAQNHQGILYHMLLAWGKIIFKNSKYGFYFLLKVHHFLATVR